MFLAVRATSWGSDPSSARRKIPVPSISFVIAEASRSQPVYPANVPGLDTLTKALEAEFVPKKSPKTLDGDVEKTGAPSRAKSRWEPPRSTQSPLLFSTFADVPAMLPINTTPRGVFLAKAFVAIETDSPCASPAAVDPLDTRAVKTADGCCAATTTAKLTSAPIAHRSAMPRTLARVLIVFLSRNSEQPRMPRGDGAISATSMVAPQ